MTYIDSDSRRATISTAFCDRDTPSDEEMVERARQGDNDAFGELIVRHGAHCINIATFILRDRVEAQDAVQRAYCNAFRHLDQLHNGSAFACWLLRIVKNQCLILLRVRSRVRLVHLDVDVDQEGSRPFDLASENLDAEQDLAEQEMHEVVHREIRRIPPLLRSVLVLRDVEELPMAAIAGQLRISVAAAKSRLLRARHQLRERVLLHYRSKGRRPSSNGLTLLAKTVRR